MKKLSLLLGIAVLSFANINASQRLTEKQRQRIEDVLMKKAEHQRLLARPEIYTMVDSAVGEKSEWEYNQEGKPIIVETMGVNWPVLFNILDSMRGAISVNEYRTFQNNYPLLWIAVKQGNALAAKTLLEKYKANPNVRVFVSYFIGEDLDFKEMTPLMLAREQGDNAMANLLMRYGAR